MIVRPEDLDQPVSQKSNTLVVSPNDIQPIEKASNIEKPSDVHFDFLDTANEAINNGSQIADKILTPPGLGEFQNPVISATMNPVYGAKAIQDMLGRIFGAVHGLTSAAVPKTNDQGDLDILKTAAASASKGFMEPGSVPLPGAQFQQAYPNLHWAVSGGLGSALDILPLLLGGKEALTKELSTNNKPIIPGETGNIGAELRDLAKSNPEAFKERFAQELQKRSTPEQMAKADEVAGQFNGKSQADIEKIFNEVPQPKGEPIVVSAEDVTPADNSQYMQPAVEKPAHIVEAEKAGKVIGIDSETKLPIIDTKQVAEPKAIKSKSAIKNPKTLGAHIIKTYGGIRPDSVTNAGFNVKEDFMQSGARYILNHKGEHFSRVAADLASQGLLHGYKEGDSEGQALMDALKAKQAFGEKADEYDKLAEQEYQNYVDKYGEPTTDEINSLKESADSEAKSQSLQEIESGDVFGGSEQVQPGSTDFPFGGNEKQSVIPGTESKFPDQKINPTDKNLIQEKPKKDELFQERSANFYSQLQKTVEEKMPNATSPDQVRGILKNSGIKQDEMDWLDIEGFLKDKQKVTKQELLDYIKQNDVQIEEVQKGQEARVLNPEEMKRLSHLTELNQKSPGGAIEDIEPGSWNELLTLENIRDKSTLTQLLDKQKEYEKLAQQTQAKGNQKLADKYWELSHHFTARSEELDLSKPGEGGLKDTTKFSQLQLTGGQNYKELLLTLPFRQGKGVTTVVVVPAEGGTYAAAEYSPSGNFSGFVSRNYKNLEAAKDVAMKYAEKHGIQFAGKMKEVAPKQNFKSSHFEETNVLAHVRFNDRTDSEGKKVLFIEEVQSDWHQKGRKEGYGGNKEIVEEQSTSPGGLPVIRYRIEGNPFLYPTREAAHRDLVDRHGTVPNAPFKKTEAWSGLALKRMLRYAAENGYDKIAWTTGAQQNDRYKLSQQIQAIEWYENTAGRKQIELSPKGGSEKIIVLDIGTSGKIISVSNGDQKWVGQPLEDVIGKGVTEKINSETKGLLSGTDLDIGGEGMKGFYDQMIPAFLNKYTKKWGGRVGSSEINAEQPGFEYKNATHKVHSLELTPSMKQSVMGGQPLFQREAPGKESTFAVESKKIQSLLEKHDIKDVIISLVDAIQTPSGIGAAGSYVPKESKIKLIQNPKETTGYHESFHMLIRKTALEARARALFPEIMSLHGAENEVHAEEMLADWFADYANGRENPKWSTKIKQFFKDLWESIKKFFGKQDIVNELYKDLFEGPKKDIVSNEKGQVSLAPLQVPADLLREAINILNPKTFVPRESLDIIMKKKGELDKIEFELEAKLKDIEKAMEKWPKAEQIAFIDNIKLGQPQATPEIQKIAEMMRKVEDNYHAEAEKYKPGLAYKDNHYRVLWKEIPGAKAAQASKGFKGLFRRPIQGSKGFMKQSTLQDMSEGLAKGGVPYSYNPMTMWRNSLMDMQKFITSQRMWKALKDIKQVKFVKAGQDAPEGFVKLNDRIAKVYFPTEQGLVNTGEYYIEENAGRILNNFLSPDFIRSSKIGNSLLALKNVTTAIELSISPFHAAFESVEAMSSNVGLGLQKMYNRGLLQADPKAFLDGLKDIVTAPISPATAATLGGKAIRFMTQENFLNSAAGKSFIKAFPDAEELLNDLFIGGGKLAMHQDYKINSLKAFQEGIKNKEPWAVAMSAIPAINETMMKPLFEVYIPRLKIGFFLKEYSNELAQRSKQLANGSLTRAQLARQVWDSVENRFGEMNFDNLFWDKTFKSALQLVFRSVTWKLGSLKNIGGAIPQQIKEFTDAAKDRRAPLLHRNMAWLLGLGSMVAAFSTIIMQAYLKENPKNMKDLIAPRYDKQGNRISLNSYLKDIIHIKHSPSKYLTSSLSGEFGKIADLWQNKDFYGTEIVHEDDPAVKKMFDAVKYLFPKPFSISNFQQVSESQAPGALKVLTAAGVTQPAPGYITHTPAEEMALKILKDNMPVGARTMEQYQDSKLKSDLRKAYDKTGDKTPIMDAVKNDKLSVYDAVSLVQNRGQSLLARLSKHMSYGQVSKIMDVANPEEFKELKDIFVKKIVNKIKSTNDPREIEMAMASHKKIFKKYNLQK